jgi:hypothetical protein
MTARATIAVWLGAATALALSAPACSDDLEAGAPDVDAGAEDDPLLGIDDTIEPGTLEEIQRTVIVERCSGQPGLCHNGQFEPNLSTTANTYAYLVNRPALENGARLRVDPGDPDSSFIIDKLRNRNVQTQMPLGAEPLAAEEITMIEDWISAGALREPGADDPVVLNNPPLPPEVGVYNGATRLDGVGATGVPRNVPITFRHSVSDFETADASIPLGVVILQQGDGKNVVLAPGADDPATGITTFDAAGPMGAGDLLNFRFTFTFGTSVDMIDDLGVITSEPSAGKQLQMIVLYLDALPPAGILTFTIVQNMLVVE